MSAATLERDLHARIVELLDDNARLRDERDADLDATEHDAAVLAEIRAALPEATEDVGGAVADLAGLWRGLSALVTTPAAAGKPLAPDALGDVLHARLAELTQLRVAYDTTREERDVLRPWRDAMLRLVGDLELRADATPDEARACVLELDGLRRALSGLLQDGRGPRALPPAEVCDGVRLVLNERTARRAEIDRATREVDDLRAKLAAHEALAAAVTEYADACDGDSTGARRRMVAALRALDVAAPDVWPERGITHAGRWLRDAAGYWTEWDDPTTDRDRRGTSCDVRTPADARRAMGQP